MNAERDASRFIYEDSCIIEVLLTCGKQGLPVNVEVVPCWLNGDRVGQERAIWIVNLPSFGKRNALSSIAPVCHSKHSADRDRRRSDTSPVLANMSRSAEGERSAKERLGWSTRRRSKAPRCAMKRKADAGASRYLKIPINKPLYSNDIAS